MNITLMRFKPVLKELSGIRVALERIADCMETDMAQQGFNMKVPVSKPEGPEPTISYVDETADYLREEVEFLKRRDALEAREQEESDGLNVFKQDYK